MSDEQPRAEWIFPEERKTSKGRIWLIIGLVVAAVGIVGIVLFFLIPRDGGSAPTPSPSLSTASPSPSPTAASSSSATPTPDPEPEPTPITTQPPVADPELDTFTGQVQGWLNDATTGLGLVSNMSGQEASQVVDTLQGDADRLSSAVAPSSISDQWYSAAGTYAMSLSELRSAVDNDIAVQVPLDKATAALQQLRIMVGL